MTDTNPSHTNPVDSSPAADADPLTQDELDALQALGEALGVADPVPDAVVAFARAIPSWARLDGELAELLEDTALEGVGAGVRSAGDTAERVLSFETDLVTVEVQVATGARGDGTLNIDGQLAPSAPGRVELHRSGGFDSVVADELGRFRFDGASDGLVALVISVDGVAIHTPWFRI